MYEFASSSATLLTVYTAVMHTRRMNVIPEEELWNYDTCLNAFDDKRYILQDGVGTLSYGHFRAL